MKLENAWTPTNWSSLQDKQVTGILHVEKSVPMFVPLEKYRLINKAPKIGDFIKTKSDGDMKQYLKDQIGYVDSLCGSLYYVVFPPKKELVLVPRSEMLTVVTFKKGSWFDKLSILTKKILRLDKKI